MCSLFLFSLSGSVFGASAIFRYRIPKKFPFAHTRSNIINEFVWFTSTFLLISFRLLFSHFAFIRTHCVELIALSIPYAVYTRDKICAFVLVFFILFFSSSPQKIKILFDFGILFFATHTRPSQPQSSLWSMFFFHSLLLLSICSILLSTFIYSGVSKSSA